MTAEFVTPTSRETLPGRPAPFFLAAGEGERAHLFDQLFTVLLSGDETEGQFGVFTMEAPRGQAIPVHSHDDVHEIFYVLDGRVRVAVEDADGGLLDRVLTTGDFGYVPAGRRHTFRVESHRARTLGVSTGGFERFFAAAGERTDLDDAARGARRPLPRAARRRPPAGTATSSTTMSASSTERAARATPRPGRAPARPRRRRHDVARGRVRGRARVPAAAARPAPTGTGRCRPAGRLPARRRLARRQPVGRSGRPVRRLVAVAVRAARGARVRGRVAGLPAQRRGRLPGAARRRRRGAGLAARPRRATLGIDATAHRAVGRVGGRAPRRPARASPTPASAPSSTGTARPTSRRSPPTPPRAASRSPTRARRTPARRCCSARRVVDGPRAGPGGEPRRARPRRRAAVPAAARHGRPVRPDPPVGAPRPRPWRPPAPTVTARARSTAPTTCGSAGPTSPGPPSTGPSISSWSGSRADRAAASGACRPGDERCPAR